MDEYKINENLDFESALAELEKIVKELESDIKLSKAVELFEYGSKLNVICNNHLNQAAGKIELLKRHGQNELVLEPYNNEK